MKGNPEKYIASSLKSISLGGEVGYKGCGLGFGIRHVAITLVLIVGGIWYFVAMARQPDSFNFGRGGNLT